MGGEHGQGRRAVAGISTSTSTSSSQSASTSAPRTDGLARRELLSIAGALALGTSGAAIGLLGCAPEDSRARSDGGSASGAEEAGDALIATWNEFCESLKQAAPPLLRAPARSPRERASGLRYLTRLISQTLDHSLEFDDPAFPQLYRSQGITSQQGGPNPDTSYIDARISGDYAYRLFGRRGGVRFVTFSTQRGLAALKQGLPGFVDNLVGDALEVAADGSFEILIARERPAGHRGNFLRTSADTERLAIREIFGRWHEEEPMDLHLERIAGEGALQPPVEFDEIARRVRAAGAQVAFMSDFWVKDLARFLDRPNTFQEYQERDPDKRSVAYTPGGRALVGVWQIEPDEALVLEVEPPASPYWGYEIGDYWFEVDYYGGFSGANSEQIVVDADGLARVVVAHVDPGGWPNWLSTSGQSIGHWVFRWLESSEEVMPRVTRVALDALDDLLPVEATRIGPAERARQLADRRAGLRRRWPV